MNTIGFTAVDIFIGLIILIFCILGFVKGAIRQFFGIAALVLSSAASIAAPFFIKLPEIEGISSIWKDVIFSVLVWVPSFLILNSIGKFIAKKMSKKPPFTDRIWGAMFGALKGLIIFIVIIFLIDAMPSNLRDSIPESKVINVLRPYNPLFKIQIMQNLQAILSAIKDPDYMELLSKEPNFQKLKQRENIKSMLNDPEINRILTERQYINFFTNPKVRSLIEDKETLKLLLSTDIDKAVISNI